MKKHLSILFLGLVVFNFSCKEDKTTNQENKKPVTPLILKYAKGFSVTDYGDYKILEITKPWPKAQKSYKYRLQPVETTFEIENRYDAVIKYPIEKIVVTSTTHIPALELLNVEDALIGFPGTDYISSTKTRKRIENGEVRNIGQNEGMNTEVLLDLNPDVVVGFGVDGVNKTFETLKKVGIPVLYDGDWVEDSALAKAEWIKFFGVLFNKESEADSIFDSIESNYLKAKRLALKSTSKPTVLSGAMHKDIWYLPSSDSSEAKFLEDANTNYLWKNSKSEGSLALSFEVVYEKAKDAEIWLSPSYYSSYEQLARASNLYTNFKAFKTKSIYTFSNTKGKTGGVLYYELGTARPDLVLKDLIKINHPELLPNYKLNFFAPLK